MIWGNFRLSSQRRAISCSPPPQNGNVAPISQGRNSRDSVNNNGSQVGVGEIFAKQKENCLDAYSSLEKTVRVLADPVECSKYLGIADGSAFGKGRHEKEQVK